MFINLSSSIVKRHRNVSAIHKAEKINSKMTFKALNISLDESWDLATEGSKALEWLARTGKRF
jgi:hypothetical protein